MGWKRFVSIGCTHGHMIDSVASKAVLGFVRRWKPHTRVHHGDYIDMAAFRSGSAGTADEAADIKLDLRAGLRFLEEFRPTMLINGNHDDRLWKDMSHPNAIRAHAAQCIVTEIRGLVEKLKCRHLEDYGIDQWLTIGNCKLMHGTFYNEAATRDYAEHYGDCIHAHTHKPGVTRGRRFDHPVAFCTGTLVDIKQAGYAKTRRATTQWGAGVVYGEYNDTACRRWLAQEIDGRWNFPL